MANKKSVPASQARKEGKPMAAENKDFTQVIIPFGGQTYTLEFNARVVKTMERRGFQLNMDFPMTCADDLWLGALQMHHKGITPDRAKEIWEAQTRKDDLLAALVTLYSKPFKDMMSDPDGVNENADPTWTTA